MHLRVSKLGRGSIATLPSVLTANPMQLVDTGATDGERST
jgi:hypothetical protein